MPERTPPRGRVLVVEDEAYVRASLRDVLRARGFDVDLAAGVAEAFDSLARSPVDVVLTDLRMPDSDGLELVRRAWETYPEIPVVVLTGQGTIPSAVDCVKAGATDYILKPADPDALEVALDRAIETRALKREVDYLRRGGEDDPEDAGLPVGVSPAWSEAMKRARAAAPSDATVLLLGESGTGKELVARMIHRLSRRARGPYVRVNCAAIPIEMWESEFFGHRKGSFTGASADREGRFRLAHRGTLFMDEIGTMPLAAQAKILRVLQDGEFDRLGDERPTRVDVRIVAATNCDLPAEVAAGRFRQDLFYRLNLVRVDLPPLRDRPDDLPLLATRFARQIAARLGRPAAEIGAEVMAEMEAYPWPGNVRELQNVIERALILNPGPTLGPLDLPGVPSAIGSEPGAPTAAFEPPPGSTPRRPAGGELNLRTALGRREREVVLDALKRSGGLRKEAARLLGIDQRNLGYYLRKHRIDPDRAS
ncbi:MAG TPA: sigma-54 dependent transcriptional regulator [Candidatus Polarisedimenticolia bacterium]|nr:sigma-54 dependent transcriptional regulator [Candidatus Polarisedimenticolia bacterium]